MTDLATIIERKGAKSKEYPADWDIIALRIKEIAKWRCERCHADFDPGLNISRKGNGFVLTVHHLDGNKKNCQQYNLAALCQRCHLRIQARVEFLRDSLDGIHSYRMSRHVKGYNVEARLYGKRELTLTEVREKDYSDEWADSPQNQQSHLYALRNFLSHGYTVRTIAGSHELYNETKRNFSANRDRKSTRLNSSHTVIYTLSLHDALPISSIRTEKFLISWLYCAYNSRIARTL